jgi:hypothetical protein
MLRLGKQPSQAHLRDPQPAEAFPPPHRTGGSSSTPFRSCRGSRARIAHLRALLRSNPGRRRRRGAALPTIPNSRSRSTLQNSPPVPSHSEIALCAQIPGNFLSDRLLNCVNSSPTPRSHRISRGGAVFPRRPDFRGFARCLKTYPFCITGLGSLAVLEDQALLPMFSSIASRSIRLRLV